MQDRYNWDYNIAYCNFYHWLPCSLISRFVLFVLFSLVNQLLKFSRFSHIVFVDEFLHSKTLCQFNYYDYYYDDNDCSTCRPESFFLLFLLFNPQRAQRAGGYPKSPHVFITYTFCRQSVMQISTNPIAIPLQIQKWQTQILL